MPQWIIKAVIIFLYVAPPAWLLYLALFVSWRVIGSNYVTLAWLNPLRVGEQYVSEQLQGKARVPDAIYQDEMIVGRLRGEPRIDENGKAVTFPRLIRTDALEPGRSFVFRTWELKLVPPMPGGSAVSVGGTIVLGGEDVSLPELEGRVLEEAHARILRRLF